MPHHVDVLSLPIGEAVDTPVTVAGSPLMPPLSGVGRVRGTSGKSGKSVGSTTGKSIVRNGVMKECVGRVWEALG